MAFSRFFGKSKKDPPSPSGSNHSPDLSEREGDDNFTVVEQQQNPAPGSNDQPPTYNSVSQLLQQVNSVSQLPYQLPGAAGGGGAGAARPNFNKQISHPLEGVVFHLSPKLTTDPELDQMAATVDSVMARIKNVEWAAFDYNFSLEQSVLSTDISVEGVRIN